jgi:hypothetical protein
LTVTLLAVVVLRRLAAAVRRPTAGELACLFGLGLLVCSLAQTPLPWQQLRRLRQHVPSAFAQPLGQTFVAAHTHRDEAVTIMTTLGHRMAFNLHLKDVEAFTGAFSVFTTEQLDRSLAALRAVGGGKVFLNATDHYEGLDDALRARGFALRAQEPRVGMQLWTR